MCESRQVSSASRGRSGIAWPGVIHSGLVESLNIERLIERAPCLADVGLGGDQIRHAAALNGSEAALGLQLSGLSSLPM
jgi:hypothetical protein